MVRYFSLDHSHTIAWPTFVNTPSGSLRLIVFFYLDEISFIRLREIVKKLVARCLEIGCLTVFANYFDFIQYFLHSPMSKRLTTNPRTRLSTEEKVAGVALRPLPSTGKQATTAKLSW
jgi:hypothetical protein